MARLFTFTAMLRYPLSHLILFKSLRGIGETGKRLRLHALQNILTGEDQSYDFVPLSPSDRKAILEIPQDTKPDFAAYLMK